MLKRGKDEPPPSFYPGGRPAAHGGHVGAPGEHCQHCSPQLQVSFSQDIKCSTAIYTYRCFIIKLLFRKVDLSHTFCQLLTMLAVFDSILVVSAVISFSLPLISQHWNLVILFYISNYSYHDLHNQLPRECSS